MSLLKWLEHLDKTLFVLIQHDSDHSVLDVIMPVFREPLTWIPLYVFMLIYAFRMGKRRADPGAAYGHGAGSSKAWAFIGLTLLTFAVTDSVTAQILKPMFGRLRPCHDPELQPYLRALVDCGGLYSMPSNHAANHFGLAAFWYFSIREVTGRKWRWLWVWAALICYAQVYVGKHYPFDILVGAIFGTLTGLGMSRLFVIWEHRQGHGMPFLRHSLKKSAEMGKV
ncbi:MAG TPA: phosphatase PAP2 family protein [Puia sp.]|nr:phosphatase PAP2 family protein [Puia sp.]